MPDPTAGESRENYLTRCIPRVLKDGTAQDEKQAAAVCYSMWRDRGEKRARKWGRRRKSLANTPLNLLVAKVHRAYTTAADELFMRGYITQDERKGFGKLIGEFLGGMRDGVREMFPNMTTTMVSPQDVDEVAATKAAQPFTVYKQADGTYRWVLLSSNSFEDRDREIVSQKALEADVERADRDGDYGPLLWWHLDGQPDSDGNPRPRVELGDCTFNMMHGRVLVEAGTFRKKEYAEAAQRHAAELGVSIGFTHPKTEPDARGVFRAIRRYERSLLPREFASNPLASIAVVQKESAMPTLLEKVKAFATFMGADESTAKEMLALAERTENGALAEGRRHKAKKMDGEMDEDEKPVTESAAADAPIPKAEAEDDEAPQEDETKKKEAAPAIMGDMTPDEFNAHILTTLKSWGEGFRAEIEKVVAADTATTKERQETALKEFGAKVDTLQTSIKQALDGVAELKGELPRVLGERPTVFQPSKGGAEPDEKLKASAKQMGPDNADWLSVHFNALTKAAGQAPQPQ